MIEFQETANEQVELTVSEAVIEAVSPKVSAEAITGGTRVTITDVDGAKSFDVMDGEDGEPGADGVSPAVSVSKSGGTATITITDATGTTTATVSDGEDGEPGDDGYSPSASVSKSGSTATITITDKTGTTTATISDGADGEDGDDGYSPSASVSKSGDTATISITDKTGTTTATIPDATGALNAVNANFRYTGSTITWLNRRINSNDAVRDDSSENEKHTDYIPIVGGQSLYFRTHLGSYAYCFVYDASKTVLSSYNLPSGKTSADPLEFNVTAPANAAYLRISCSGTSNLPNVEIIIGGAANAINGLQAAMTAAESDIDTLETAVSGAASDIGTLQTAVSGAESNITTLQTNVSSLQTAVSSDLNTAYVATTGSDSNAGTKAAPFATIAKAFQKSSIKTVIVSAGTYTQNFTLTDRDVRIICRDGKAHFSGSSQLGVVWLARCNFELIGIEASGGGTNGFHIVDSNGVFRDCVSHGNTMQGFSLRGSEVTLYHCEAYSNGVDGFNGIDTTAGVSKGTFIDCSAHDNDDDGLSYHQTGKMYIYGGEYADNAYGGIVPHESSDCEIHGANIHGNTTGIEASAGETTPSTNATLVVTDCLIRGNTKGIRAKYYDVLAVGNIFSGNTTDADIDATATYSVYDCNLVVSVSGSTPSITGKAGIRYVCGECSTLSITPPASGIIDVRFTSGTSPTVLTVTPPTGMTMKWANGFDPDSLDANTVYEINILDGEFGVVGAWT